MVLPSGFLGIWFQDGFISRSIRVDTCAKRFPDFAGVVFLKKSLAKNFNMSYRSEWVFAAVVARLAL